MLFHEGLVGDAESAHVGGVLPLGFLAVASESGVVFPSVVVLHHLGGQTLEGRSGLRTHPFAGGAAAVILRSAGVESVSDLVSQRRRAHQGVVVDVVPRGVVNGGHQVAGAHDHLVVPGGVEGVGVPCRRLGHLDHEDVVGVRLAREGGHRPARALAEEVADEVVGVHPGVVLHLHFGLFVPLVGPAHLDDHLLQLILGAGFAHVVQPFVALNALDEGAAQFFAHLLHGRPVFRIHPGLAEEAAQAESQGRVVVVQQVPHDGLGRIGAGDEVAVAADDAVFHEVHDVFQRRPLQVLVEILQRILRDHHVVGADAQHPEDLPDGGVVGIASGAGACQTDARGHQGLFDAVAAFGAALPVVIVAAADGGPHFLRSGHDLPALLRRGELFQVVLSGEDHCLVRPQGGVYLALVGRRAVVEGHGIALFHQLGYLLPGLRPGGHAAGDVSQLVLHLLPVGVVVFCAFVLREEPLELGTSAFADFLGELFLRVVLLLLRAFRSAAAQIGGVLPCACGVAVEVVAGIGLPVDVGGVLCLFHDVSRHAPLGYDGCGDAAVVAVAAGADEAHRCDGHTEIFPEDFHGFVYGLFV